MKRTTISALSALGLTLSLSCSSETLSTTGLGPAPAPVDAVDDSNATAEPPQPSEMEEGTQPAGSTDVSESPSNEADLPENLVGPAADEGDSSDPANDMTEVADETPAEDDVMPAEEEVVEEPPAPLTPAQVGGQLEGFLFLSPCESQDFGHDCTLPQCQGGSKTVQRTLQLGGEPGVVYDITIHVYGVVEPRVYQGGVRRAGPNFDPNTTDFWYEGGQLPANTGTYNSYEMHVEPPVPGAPNAYFLNSRTGGDTPFLIRLDYEATFPVQGGGTIRWRTFDLNCRQITNCNDNECGSLGPKPLTQPTVAGANPPPPATFTQPFQSAANAGLGQWIYIDVTAVAPRE